ncbi:hypothetical protein INT47_006328 [Mucor saturninus]|uniref:Carrier domain-containing protein n=1 Tax=Mucor saturninus TaxID=64648 RepID=A0A8H7VE64_9FUNG|nr:hypothetical protein INT47_006328 [Mucor saturninus]
MNNIELDPSVSFSNGLSVPNHFKAFTNFMNVQSKIHADKPFASYYHNESFKDLSYSQVNCMATNLACKWAKDAQNTEVLSFISDHGVNYLIVMLAMMKLRVTMMAISPRNSEAANVSLLEKTKSKLLIANVKYENIAKSVSAQVPGVKLIVLEPLDINALSEEPLNPDHQKLLNTTFSDSDIEKSALIIHSSGSTAFPKPIYLSNRYLFNMINLTHFNINDKEGLDNLDDTDCFLSCGPLFHIFGFFAIFTMATVGGKVAYLEKLPASQAEIDFALKANRCTAICAPPLIFEQMIPYLKEKNDFSAVKRLKIAIYGGAPLKHEAGEWLHAHGLNVRDVYGTTEIGAVMSSDFNPVSKNWGSLAPYQKDPSGEYYGVFEVNDESDPSVKHLYIRGDSPSLATGVSNRPDGGFNTNDLFKENPNFPGFYDYLGRRDDTLIMENGEKTNPVPMEATIRQHPTVKQVAVIGQGRQCTAALIQVDMDFAINSSPEDIISDVQDAVKEANKDCPGHSVILPQMIKILPLNQTLPSTDKGTVMRKKAESAHQDLVEKLYKNFLEGPSRDTSNTDTSTWNAEEVRSFIITCASEVLDISKSTFHDHDQSVFDHGLNSLSSIQLRNRIAEYFDDVPQNFLFQHPSVSSMCEALMNNQQEDPTEQMEKRYQQTQELAIEYLKKAKTDFPVATNTYNKDTDKVILLTGVTGSLGSFMLRDLLKDSSVKKVYAVIRGKQEQLWDRLLNAFKSRSLDTSLLNTDRVEVLPMRFVEPFLGFGEEKYHQLKNEITIVQHCAWLLDFNMPVDHYDKECITPFYNLLKFAHRAVNPMHVHFVSSISASAAYGSNIPEEPLPLDAHVCMPMGYAHSKFVVEILLNYLTSEKNFPCYTERLGQVCGDSSNGVWNISEQYPLMFIGGGSIMHKMPGLDTTIDWITVDYAAASIVDIMLRTAYFPADKNQSIYHIVNPQHISWNSVLQSMKNAGMKFDVISPADWVKELSKHDTNPAYKLMSFYEANFQEAFEMPVWETTKTCNLTPIIADSPILDSKLFSKFLNRWESVGFYNPIN